MSVDKPVEIDKNLFILQNALRPPASVGIEGLLASELATALYSPPLEKIRHIMEAFLLLDDGLVRKIGISKNDKVLYHRIHQLAIDFQNSRLHTFGWSIMAFIRIYVPFSFSLSDVSKYLFWIGDYKPEYQSSWDAPNPKVFDEYAVKICENDDLCYQMVRTYLYGRNGVLSYSSYYDLRNRFISYSMPKALDLSQRIFKLINYDVWSETLALVRGGKYYGRTESNTD